MAKRRSKGKGSVTKPVLSHKSTGQSKPVDDATLRPSLSEFKGLALYSLVLVSPILIGALAVTGLRSMSLRPWPLFLAIGALGVLNLTATMFGGSNVSSVTGSKDRFDPKVIFCGLLLAVLLYLFVAAVHDTLSVILFVLSSILFAITLRIRTESAKSVLFLGGTVVELMVLLALLGSVTQFPGVVIPGVALLGLCPALLLAAALFAEFAVVFEQQGWKRTRSVVGKDGTAQTRPAGLCRLFSMTMVLGVGIPMVVYPLGFLPVNFIIVAIPLWWMPGLFTAFSDGSESDHSIAVKSLRLSGLMALLMVIIAATSP